jgi:hypothetical protein
LENSLRDIKSQSNNNYSNKSIKRFKETIIKEEEVFSRASEQLQKIYSEEFVILIRERKQSSKLSLINDSEKEIIDEKRDITIPQVSETTEKAQEETSKIDNDKSKEVSQEVEKIKGTKKRTNKFFFVITYSVIGISLISALFRKNLNLFFNKSKREKENKKENLKKTRAYIKKDKKKLTCREIGESFTF